MAVNTSPVANSSNLSQRWTASLQNAGPGFGPGWLQSLRAAAASGFRQHGLPGNKDEAWKYTSLKRLEELHPDIDLVASNAGTSDWVGAPPEILGFGFRFAAGRLEWLEKAAPAGVSLRSLKEVWSGAGGAPPARLRTLFEAVDVSGRSRAFEALNTAVLNDGVVIQVAAGVDAGDCLVQWGQSGATPRLDNFRLILLLETGARLRLFEQFQGSAATAGGGCTGHALNLVLLADLAADAQLQHIRLQQEAASDVLLTGTEVHQSGGSDYHYSGFDLGGGLVRHGIRCLLAGPGARAVIDGVFVLDGEQHIDNHVCVDHLTPGCSSEQFFRGVLGGRSRGVFNGKALIRPGADGSKVRQSNANLLLSELAEMDTKPELEIYADEVEASHGATVGQLDEQAVFYLRTRGIEEADARRLLTSAFCRVVLGRLADPGLAEQLGVMLDTAMPGHPGKD